MIIIIITTTTTEYTKAQDNCSPLIDHCPAHPQAVIPSPNQLPPAYIFSMPLHSMEYPFSQFGSCVLTLSPPGFLCTSPLAEHEELSSP